MFVYGLNNKLFDFRIKQTKAAIKVFSQCCPMSTERICAIQGNSKVVIDAIKTVLDIILASPIKGPVKLYDPFNFDVYAAPDYGGYTDPGPSGAFRHRSGSSNSFGNSARNNLNRMGRRSSGPARSQWQHEVVTPDPWLPGSVPGRIFSQADRRGIQSTPLYGANRWQSNGTLL